MTSRWSMRLAGIGVAVLVFALDQWVKWLMRSPLDLMNVQTIEILPFFNLHWTENYGVSLGMLTAQSAEMRWLLIALTATIAAGVFIWMMREKAWVDVMALGLVLGGAAGNIRDRYMFGFVIDYADLHFGTFRPFLIFNIADAAITIGVLIILARSFLSREKHDRKGTDASPDAAPES
jgi:signal peptidase II